MSSPPNPPGRFEKKYTHFPSAEYAGSKSLASESNDTAAGALQLSPLSRDIQMSHPPGPPLRSVDPHKSVVPSGLAASRISECSLDTTPGATSSADELIASVGGPPPSAPVDAAPPHAAHAAQLIHSHMRIAATLPHRASHPVVAPRRCSQPPAESGGLELADDGGHGRAGAAELVGLEGDAADRSITAAAKPGAQRADVVPTVLLAPRVDADRDLDAVGVARAGDSVEAVGVQEVAEEAGAARAGLVEAVEHDDVAVPRADPADRVELAGALVLDLGELGGDLGARGDRGERVLRQPLDVAGGGVGGPGAGGA